MTSPTGQPLQVLIVGGGVAALEGALALRDLAGERVSLTMLAPEPEFVYRPMRVLEPFSAGGARRYPLELLARDLGMELRQGSFKWLDPTQQVVHTDGGDRMAYDALLLALGARPHARFKHALTLDDRRLDEQLHGLIQDVEGGYARELAFVAPSRMPWPLPLYELALMTARRAWDTSEDVSVTIVTPEAAPLEVFGEEASERVARLLGENGILVITSAECDTPAPGEVVIRPGARRLHADRIIALPELSGPEAPGVPHRDRNGFITVDVYCRVSGLDRAYAAGDATNFTLKHGGLAAQQADVAAASIAALAGAPVRPFKFDPVIEGTLLGGDHPLHLRARIIGGRGARSEVYDGAGRPKITAKFLTPYLESHDAARVL